MASLDRLAHVSAAAALHCLPVQVDTAVRQAVHRSALRAVGPPRHVQRTPFLWDSTDLAAIAINAQPGFPSGIHPLIHGTAVVREYTNVQTRVA